MADHPLKSLSLHEKLSYFYCAYAREEAIDPEVDVHAVRLWEKIKVSRRKCRERVAFLLQHVENVSQSQVRHLDSTYRAKRELLLLAEGTIGPTASSGRTDNALAQAESARINNELLQDCGALSVFSEHLQRSIHAFRTLNFQHLDMDQVDTMIRELQQDMVLMFMLILFNANRQNASFDRQLLFLGTSAPSYTLVAIIDCLIQMNVLPGFPIKRLLMLFHEWFAAILGDTVALDKLKLLRSFKEFTDSHSMALDPQDAYYLQKRRFAKIRQEIHDNHVCKGEYVAHFFLDANLVSTLTKFMNKDLATYLQVPRQESDDQRTGLWALEIDIMRKNNIRSEDSQNEFAIQPTRIITSILRILQKMTKRKPNVIKNALLVSLGVSVPRLYALKLVKSQAKYLGHQWVRKYTCFNLLTDVYIHVRPELDDDWLRYEDEDLSKPPQQDSKHLTTHISQVLANLLGVSSFKRRQSSPNTTRCDLRIPCRLLISIISLQLLLAWPIKQPGFFKRDTTRSLLPRGCGIWRALMWKQHIRGILGNGIDSHHLPGWRRRFFTLWRIVGMVENVSYFGDDFGQKIDLTVRIREILRNYPEGTSIFKEMVQNADDAGATEVAFCLDYRHHAAERLAYGKLKDFQGPALLVYNNATFSETDFESIQVPTFHSMAIL
ncbi:hypothetical protein P43SY_001764 [Pythium insidiosum]|uniref:Far11/STRP N-terminal domain-containing protein n=1 Tax=Pythium insidiosum TaxID=114742 RepID=A0AAD5M6Z6_PYTIN|nr:hypothetical protein P43SY_001764 [Pythium insidiosum]